MNHIRRTYNHAMIIGRIADDFNMTNESDGVPALYLEITTESIIKIDQVKKERVAKIPVMLYGQSALFIQENAVLGTRLLITGSVERVSFVFGAIKLLNAVVVVAEHVQILSPYKLGQAE